MPLNYQNQVSLLKDILAEHCDDCCGTSAECEQVERLVKSLMANTQIDQNLKSVLQNIYSYSHNGINAPVLNDHIASQKDNLTQWLSDIDSFS
ncbi:YtzH-like family protein [Metabacillus sp. GX 13764]|uniref:YtzH-like family protein n=1 Tax=Metabacillus kandeliae TaxID=2900151 RepID=UPI001E470AAD|nr:YtzH-like family protein [Metabacillus kandeliae]MCD7032712.1 YtzH-like family protein [Metabacillus kandeliae]